MSLSLFLSLSFCTSPFVPWYFSKLAAGRKNNVIWGDAASCSQVWCRLDKNLYVSAQSLPSTSQKLLMLPAQSGLASLKFNYTCEGSVNEKQTSLPCAGSNICLLETPCCKAGHNSAGPKGHRGFVPLAMGREAWIEWMPLGIPPSPLSCQGPGGWQLPPVLRLCGDVLLHMRTFMSEG